MIAVWMLYAVVLSLFLAGAALLLEKALHMLGRPSRRVWASAMLAGAALPVVSWLLSSGAGEAAGGSLGPARELMGSVGPWLLSLDGALLWAWLVVSVLLAAFVALAAVRVQAGRRRWGRATLEGVPVRISDDVGPAVVGLLRSEIVLPRWALECDALLRTLILRHEREHVQEGDHRLLAMSLLLPVLMPWNPVLFWMARQLRLALEIDCDARVLRGSGFDARTYGTLLLEVGRRRGARFLPVTGFSRPRTLLERRIERLTRRSGRASRAAGLGLAGAFVVLSTFWIPVPPSDAPSYLGIVEQSCPFTQPGASVTAEVGNPLVRPETAEPGREASEPL